MTTRRSGETVDRASPPDSGRVRPFEVPPVDSGELENGLAIRVVRLPRLPVVTVRLVLPAGEGTVPPSRAGLAGLTGDGLDGGTARRSGAELAEALEGIGSGLSVSTGWDSCTVSLSCLAERLEEAVSLLSEVVRQPEFPADEVERIRSQRLAALEQRRKNPGPLADDQLSRTIYVPESPYARPRAGVPEAVRSLDRDQVKAFSGARYRPGGGGLVVVGDVDPAEVEELARERFGDWEGSLEEGIRTPAEPLSRERRVVIVDRPAAVQSEVRIGHVGVARSSPDYFPLQVFNTILGGAFTSRLNLSLRETHGFTYGVRSRFSFRRQAGPFTVSTAVGTEVTVDAVREALSEITGLLEEGPTPEEMNRARDYIAGVFPLRFETTSGISARLGELIVYGLPDDYYDTYRDRIRAVTTEDALEAGRRHVRPGEAAVLVVGEGERIQAGLEELDLGPVEVREAP